MKIQNNRFLYESIMRDVARVVKRKLNESTGNVWDAILEINTISHVMFGYEFDELDKDERREAKIQMKDICNYVSSNAQTLRNLKVKATINRRDSQILFNNITENNLIKFSDFLINLLYLNDAGQAYVSDFEDCIDFEDILDELENTNPVLHDEFEKFVYDSLMN